MHCTHLITKARKHLAIGWTKTKQVQSGNVTCLQPFYPSITHVQRLNADKNHPYAPLQYVAWNKMARAGDRYIHWTIAHLHVPTQCFVYCSNALYSIFSMEQMTVYGMVIVICDVLMFRFYLWVGISYVFNWNVIFVMILLAVSASTPTVT